MWTRLQWCAHVVRWQMRVCAGHKRRTCREEDDAPALLSAPQKSWLDGIPPVSSSVLKGAFRHIPSTETKLLTVTFKNKTKTSVMDFFEAASNCSHALLFPSYSVVRLSFTFINSKGDGFPLRFELTHFYCIRMWSNGPNSTCLGPATFPWSMGSGAPFHKASSDQSRSYRTQFIRTLWLDCATTHVIKNLPKPDKYGA